MDKKVRNSFLILINTSMLKTHLNNILSDKKSYNLE